MQKDLYHRKYQDQLNEAALKRALGDDFKRKYNIFLTHKWRILKQFKDNLLEKKMKKVRKQKGFKAFLVRIARH